MTISCEKDLEHYYKSLIGEEIASPLGTDGYLVKNNVYLFECKHTQNISDEMISRAIMQLWFYQQRFIKTSLIIPNIFIIISDTEYILIAINDLLKYLRYELDFTIAPSKAYLEYPLLIEQVKNNLCYIISKREPIIEINNIFNFIPLKYKIDNDNYFYFSKITKLYNIDTTNTKLLLQNENILFNLQNDNSYNYVEFTDKNMEINLNNNITGNTFSATELSVNPINITMFNLGERHEIKNNELLIEIKSDNPFIVNNIEYTNYKYKIVVGHEELNVEISSTEDASVTCSITAERFIFKPLVKSFFIKFYSKNNKNLLNINDWG